MIDFLNYYANIWAEIFGLAVIQNTIFICVIFLILYIFNNLSAQTKYILTLIGVCKLLLPPFLPLFIHANDPNIILPVSELTSSIVTYDLEAISSNLDISNSKLTVLGLVFVIWLVIVLFHLLFIAFSSIRWANILKTATQIDQEDVFPMLKNPRIKITTPGVV